MDAPAPSGKLPIQLPNAPLLAVDHRYVSWLTTDGELVELNHGTAARGVKRTPPILCHTKSVATRLKCPIFPAFDVLELFAFVRPAQFCLPTVAGLAGILDLELPENLEDSPAALLAISTGLLGELVQSDPGTHPIACAMTEVGWPWGPSVLAAMGQGSDPARAGYPPR